MKKIGSIKSGCAALLALILALVMLLSACKGAEAGESTPTLDSGEMSVSDETPEETTAESEPIGTETAPGESEETPEETHPEWAVKEALTIIENGNCAYTIVRPELASEELEDAVVELKKTMSTVAGGVVKIAEDWLNPYTNQQPEEFEIIIGVCDRDETRYALQGIKYNDWIVDIVGKKVVITGYTDEGTLDAINYFEKKFLKGLSEGDTLVIDPEDCHVSRSSYALDDVTINGVSISRYSVVIPTQCAAAEKEAATALAEYLSEKTGYKIEVFKESKAESEYEILIGKTKRDESQKALDTMLYDDYTVSFDGSRVVLFGYRTENVVKACEELESLIGKEARKSRTVALTSSNNILVSFDYEVDELLLQGTNIRKYTVVYRNGDERAQMIANNIKKTVLAKLGIFLEVVNDKAAVSEHEILIGHTNRTANGGVAESLDDGLADLEGRGLLAANDNYVLVCGSDDDGFGKAATELTNKLFPGEAGKNYSVQIASSESFKVETEAVKIMSFNILTWPTQSRIEQIASIIIEGGPDVIGMQEAQPGSIAALEKIIGGTYDYVTLERDNASRESTPIWYNKEKYTLIESGSGWLSDTPDVMSKYPESEYIRVYVYVVLENKETGARFVHVNTHLDFAAAQEKQVAKLLELTSHLTYMPTFYTADWNFVSNSQGYAIMRSAGYMDVSVAVGAPNQATLISGGEIDFCFASVFNSSVDSYKVINDHEYSSAASDHYAIVADVKFIK